MDPNINPADVCDFDHSFEARMSANQEMTTREAS